MQRLLALLWVTVMITIAFQAAIAQTTELTYQGSPNSGGV